MLRLNFAAGQVGICSGPPVQRAFREALIGAAGLGRVVEGLSFAQDNLSRAKGLEGAFCRCEC